MLHTSHPEDGHHPSKVLVSSPPLAAPSPKAQLQSQLLCLMLQICPHTVTHVPVRHAGRTAVYAPHLLGVSCQSTASSVRARPWRGAKQWSVLHSWRPWICDLTRQRGSARGIKGTAPTPRKGCARPTLQYFGTGPY